MAAPSTIALALVALSLLATTIDGAARVESCPGCSLNRLAEVKAFIYDDLPEYEPPVEFKRVRGAPPELVLFERDGEEERETQRVPLSSLTREQCNALLREHGFERRSKEEKQNKSDL